MGARAVPRGPLRRGPGARDRHAARRLRQGVRPARRPSCTPTTTRARRSCGAASTSGAGCARSTAGASPPRRARCSGSCAASSAQARRALSRARRVAGVRRQRTLAAVTPSPCARASRAPCSARAPTGCRRRSAAGCRSSAARASRRSSSTPIANRPRSQDPEPVTRRAAPQPTPTTADRVRRLDRESCATLDGGFSGPLAGLRRRIYLTYRYLGWRTLLFRIVTFPLRFTPLQASPAPALEQSRRRLPPRRRVVSRARRAGRHRDPELPRRRATCRRSSRSIRATVPRGLARIIVADDASGPEHVGALRAIDGHRGRRREPRTGASRRTSTAACAHAGPDARRGAAQLRRRGPRGAGWPACSTPPRRRTTSASSARGCSIPTGASSSPAPCATSARPSGSTIATASSPATGARPGSPARRWR